MEKTKVNRGTTAGLLCILISVTLAFACSTKPETASPLPPEIEGMKLANEITGEMAAAMIARLHSKDVAPTESYIAQLMRVAAFGREV